MARERDHYKGRPGKIRQRIPVKTVYIERSINMTAEPENEMSLPLEALENKTELPEMEDPAPTAGAIDLPDIEVDPDPPKQKKEKPKDTFVGAIKFAILGAGQAGNKICQTFYDLGYRSTAIINTTAQDMASLTVPNKLVIGSGTSGAGKNPEAGQEATKKSFEDVINLMANSWAEDSEFLWIAAGLGGGTGSGSLSVLVDAVHEYIRSANIESKVKPSVGALVTLPKRSEGARTQRNALTAFQEAMELVESGKIDTLLIADNSKIHSLFPGLSVKKFWSVANYNFVSILHTFNLLACQNSEYNVFDVADFRAALKNGVVTLGMTKVADYQKREAISNAIRENLVNSLLIDGFDLSQANTAAAIVVGHDSILEELPMENIDAGFNSLSRTLGNEGIVLFNGIYEGRKEELRVFTMVSGLKNPTDRYKELEKLAK